MGVKTNRTEQCEDEPNRTMWRRTEQNNVKTNRTEQCEDEPNRTM